MLERRASLDEVVAQESESALLSEYGLVLIDGTVFEAKYQLVRYTISARDLCHFTVSDGLAFTRSQHKKAMHQAFHVPHGYRICRQGGWLEQGGTGQQNDEQLGPDMFPHLPYR